LVFDGDDPCGKRSEAGEDYITRSGPVAGNFPKKLPGLVNLQPGVNVYKMSATEMPSRADKISAPGGRSRE